MTDNKANPASGADTGKADGKAKPAPAAAKKSGAPEKSGGKTGKTAVLVVRGPERGRWRAGRKFGPEPVAIPLDDLTDGEIAALKDDPVLLVTEER